MLDLLWYRHHWLYRYLFPWLHLQLHWLTLCTLKFRYLFKMFVKKSKKICVLTSSSQSRCLILIRESLSITHTFRLTISSISTFAFFLKHHVTGNSGCPWFDQLIVTCLNVHYFFLLPRSWFTYRKSFLGIFFFFFFIIFFLLLFNFTDFFVSLGFRYWVELTEKIVSIKIDVVDFFSCKIGFSFSHTVVPLEEGAEIICVILSW